VTVTDLAGLDALGNLEPVGLDGLTDVDDLQTRRDRKYLLAPAEIDALIGAIGRDARVLTIDGSRTFRYESIYFDTVDLASYLGAAHRRPCRFKVRTRTYVDTSTCMLEVKTRDIRSRTVKHRHPYDVARRAELTDTGRQFVASIAQAEAAAHRLRPTLTTAYRRATLLIPGAAGDEARVTIDVDLAWHRPDGHGAQLDELVLIETKTLGRPCPVDRMLWRLGHRPVAISKYATGLAALCPDLPANKWNRVLRHHFGWRPAERL
jgi:VTC domain